MVQTALGKIQGIETDTCFVFKGVPYAKPPVGPLRWHAPERLDPWEGVYAADRFPPMAPQGSQEPGSFYHKEFYHDPAYTPAQSEDCLYLNIWTPKAVTEPCPVAVWFHGGAFVGGYCSEMEYDGASYARRGVILVTVGYRLGLLGYFAHPGLTARDGHSGNYGLLDQIAAIDWVRTHIQAFGGDPEKITILGQSAGAMSVRALVSSPLARGKLHGAVIQSGGGYRSPLPVNTLHQGQLESAVATAMGEMGLTLADLYQKTPQELLLLAMPLWQSVAAKTGCVLPFCPQVDRYSLLETCDEALEHGSVLPISYLIGSNENDLGSGGAAPADNPLHQSNIAFCTMQKGNPRTYLYYFRRHLPGDDMGAFHSAELWYMFGTLDRCWRPLAPSDYTLSERMLDTWAQFIRTGDPGWPAYREGHPHVEILDVPQGSTP